MTKVFKHVKLFCPTKQTHGHKMTQLDSAFSQIFNELLKNSTNHEDLFLEGEKLRKGIGPYLTKRNPNEEKASLQMKLGKEESLLGHGHPLLFKSLLKSSTNPQIYCSFEEEKSYFEGILQFLKIFTSQDIFITYPQKAALSWKIGRVPLFFPSSISEELKKNSALCIPHILGHPLWITSQKSLALSEDSPYFLNPSQVELGRNITRLLHRGNFYSEKGHIKRFEIKLKKELSSLSSVESIHGLIIQIKKRSSFFKNLYLPLYFAPSFINELKEYIMEE